MASGPKVIIVGGGIGGLTAAIALHKAGVAVSVYEQAPVLAEIGAGINVQAVAVGVLHDLGLDESMFLRSDLGDGIETSFLEYYTTDGVKIASEPVGRRLGGQFPQLSVHRAWFHNALVAKVNELGIPLHLDHAFTGMDRDSSSSCVTVHFEKLSEPGQKQPSASGDLLVGADGLKSPVRACLLGDVLPRYTGKVIYRGLTKLPSLISDGSTVCNAGNEHLNFIAYPVSDSMRQKGETYCNWGFAIERPPPGENFEDWRRTVTIDAIRDDLQQLEGVNYGGFSPLEIAERTDKIIEWAMFDRDPLESWDFGNITLLGDAAHPLLPYGSQGASQAIMDAEALGICFGKAMAEGGSVCDAVSTYSNFRAGPAGKVVIANRQMGSTAVLRVAADACHGLSRADKERWALENGQRMFDEVISEYRRSLPKSARMTVSDAPTSAEPKRE
eukprot:TRINITY_DN74453_c0_g1_i1.p1 TRINITY_DN74453_c0_g1~~TRINITY_DN74453_c0_g1_i1.p1  ORF type:complete len:461 (-),score=92.90 TRINITY_DN74453_c0_g1_i1:81-1412(-)